MSENQVEETFPEWLRRKRTEAGRTQAQFAIDLSVTAGTISKLENGTLQPSMDLAMKIAQVTGEPIDSVLLKAALITANDVKVFRRREQLQQGTLVARLSRLGPDDYDLVTEMFAAILEVFERHAEVVGSRRRGTAKELREAAELRKRYRQAVEAVEGLAAVAPKLPEAGVGTSLGGVDPSPSQAEREKKPPESE